MLPLFSRRRFLVACGVLFATGRLPAFAAGQPVGDTDDPFLGETTQGDLILAPAKTRATGMLPDAGEFFGIVRKTKVLTADANGSKINMLELFAAFRGPECHLSLCDMQTLERSTNDNARRACEAMRALARKLKARPDSVYDIQDIDKLPGAACVKNARSMIARVSRGAGSIDARASREAL